MYLNLISLFNPEVLFESFTTSNAIVDKGIVYTYGDLIQKINQKKIILQARFKQPIPVVLCGDFSVDTIAWLLALLNETYIVGLQADGLVYKQDLWKSAGIQACIIGDDDSIEVYQPTSTPSSIQFLLNQGDAGLLLLSSGTSGQPKLIVHQASRLLSKYAQSRKAYRTLGFLLFDHIAGFDTLMYTLHAGGSLITLRNRHVGLVLQHLKEYDVEVLPTTPSFINLLLFESQFNTSNLPHLKIITFGSERINEITLERLLQRFEHQVRCEQKYGLTELGSLVVKSKPGDPRWIQLDPRFASWKIENGQLFIKTKTSLIAYIFSNSEELCDGWFNTQDEAIRDGDWIRILGRKSEIINVGGQKVYPAEVESVIQSMDNVLQVVVSGAPHSLMGQVVSAQIQLKEEESESSFRSKLRVYCKDKLASFKIPVIVIISTNPIISDRFKAIRK